MARNTTTYTYSACLCDTPAPPAYLQSSPIDNDNLPLTKTLFLALAGSESAETVAESMWDV